MGSNYDQQLIKRNIKPTAMRQLVYSVLKEQITAISLTELESKFEMADRVTLYRTLKTFEDKKVIHAIEDGTGSKKYALCQDTCECHPKDMHVHFHCAKCGKTYCLNDIRVPDIKLPQNFTLESVNMVVKGLCDECKK